MNGSKVSFAAVLFELFGFVPLEFTVLNEFVGFVPLVFIKVLCFCSCLLWQSNEAKGLPLFARRRVSLPGADTRWGRCA